MNNIKHNEMLTLDRCITFLNEVGIQTLEGNVEDMSFLPGLLIENGTIVIDKTRLQYPGDLLHEAGHIAVVPSADRKYLMGKDVIKRKDREAEEIMAIAWSYAACIHLVIDPSFVFHEDGYRGGSNSIIDSCLNNEYLGMFMLQSVGMTIDKNAKPAVPDKRGYPHMTKWLRE
ncbi:hypothetical protein [Chitinophaga ginsengisoli]|uniref:IrrE N-terminal-like domain-containing protein n=1 Tax=Chitinophaga ginsengisoli TaxID=363837 RepID=A0A2P8G5C3_9BACT|nr:hypothetical protein [Chitinophaga ginsengisoli]PSL29164.1 hypothetical protein CLV42_107311 [Chitinophaga ginsengisoli]